ncbi:MAG: hypothetical protein K6G11_05170 [Lachnospiraceae bacterium]|nr:hypothetical protein [Lachnospiraceae bacterium]
MLTKESKNNPILMEAREFLLGHYRVEEDGSLTAISAMESRINGPIDGSQKIITLGISHQSYNYNFGVDNKKALKKARGVMKNIGRPLNDFGDGDMAACMIKTYVFYPTVAVFRINDNDVPELSVFTARATFAFVAILIAVRKFENAFDVDFDKETVKKKSFFEKRRERKEEKARKKAEKKEAKKEVKDLSGSNKKSKGGIKNLFSSNNPDEDDEDSYDMIMGEYIKDIDESDFDTDDYIGKELDNNMVWNGEDWVPKEQYKKKDEKMVWDGRKMVPISEYNPENEDEVWDGEKWVLKESVESDEDR